MAGLSASERRAQALAALEAGPWDLVVIGGGISGAGVAQQAARRGWRVLLVERRDFAWGTSSRSSKLVHGGLRYLRQGDVKTTWHCVRERERLMREAPELIEPQSFLFAHCAGRAPGRWPLQAGLTLSDLMAGRRSHRWADVAEVARLAPGLAPGGLRGALVFEDAKTDDARLVLRVLAEARRDGATTLNYVEAGALEIERGRVAGLSLLDVETGRRHAVRAKAVVNATGAWSDRLRAAVGGRALLRPLRGSHLLVPWWRLPVAQSISLVHPRDGRPVFFYPWEGATLIGTTDLDHDGGLDHEASISSAEVDYLIEAVNDPFPAARLCTDDVSACFAGVRPVLADGAHAPSQAARDHVVRDESGLVTLTGGKLTTFRLMAQDALALAARHAGKPFARDDAPVFTTGAPLNPRWSAAVRHRLAARYGWQAQDLCAGATGAELERVGGTPTLWLELALAARHEAVLHLDDLMLRRTRLGLLLPDAGRSHLARVAELCEPQLQWGPARWADEERRYLDLIEAHYQLPRGGTAR